MKKKKYIAPKVLEVVVASYSTVLQSVTVDKEVDEIKHDEGDEGNTGGGGIEITDPSNLMKYGNDLGNSKGIW